MRNKRSTKRFNSNPRKAKKRFHHNLRFATVLILIPLLISIFTLHYIFGNVLASQLGNAANERLLTPGWQDAQASLNASQPIYAPKFAYYQVRPGQTLDWAAAHFSVSLATLKELNPGIVTPGTTIKVPPVEAPLTPLQVTGANVNSVAIKQEGGVLHVINPFKSPQVTFNIPDLMHVLAPYHAIEQVGPKTYRLDRPISLEDNIRLDITNRTVDTLELKSSPNFNIVALTLKNAEGLVENTTITSIDPQTNKPDTDERDGRSYVRAYANSRFDVINSTATYLGMGLKPLKDPAIKAKLGFIPTGGVYGVSWRIPNNSYGKDIVTGWVENSTFEHNYIGSYTFGASGMQWKGNLFAQNTVYGLNPHDDSNNATIENNRFIKNGKHGFIVSKRCNYNIIRGNQSVDNKFHGYMLHASSVYNLIENNMAIGNQDNFVIYGSNYNTIRNNKSYNPRGSHVRINANSNQNFVEGNTFYGGSKGVYAYDKDGGLLITGNTFFHVKNQLVTKQVERVLYSQNQSEQVGYGVARNDRVVFGINTINTKPSIDLGLLNKYQ